jgi:hypothetical protein
MKWVQDCEPRALAGGEDKKAYAEYTGDIPVLNRVFGALFSVPALPGASALPHLGKNLTIRPFRI